MASKKGRSKKRSAQKMTGRKSASRSAVKAKDKGRGREKARATKPKRAIPEGRLGLVTHWRRTGPRTTRRKGKGPKGAVDEPKEATFKHPGDAAITEAIRETLIKHRVVHSQEDLRDLVMERLREKDPKFKIGGERIRHIALNMPEVRVHVDLRVMEGGMGHTKCPVCDSNMRPDKNQTVYGGVVTTGFSCPRCGYRTGLKHRSPTRYTFSLKGSGIATSCPPGDGTGADITKSWGQDGSGGGASDGKKDDGDPDPGHDGGAGGEGGREGGRGGGGG